MDTRLAAIFRSEPSLFFVFLRQDPHELNVKTRDHLQLEPNVVLMMPAGGAQLGHNGTQWDTGRRIDLPLGGQMSLLRHQWLHLFVYVLVHSTGSDAQIYAHTT